MENFIVIALCVVLGLMIYSLIERVNPSKRAFIDAFNLNRFTKNYKKKANELNEMELCSEISNLFRRLQITVGRDFVRNGFRVTLLKKVYCGYGKFEEVFTIASEDLMGRVLYVIEVKTKGMQIEAHMQFHNIHNIESYKAVYLGLSPHYIHPEELDKKFMRKVIEEIL